MRRLLLISAILVAALWLAGEAAWACGRFHCRQAPRCCVYEVPVCCQAEVPAVQPAPAPTPSPSDVAPKAPPQPKPAAPPAPAKVVVPLKPAAPPAVKAPPPVPGAPTAPPKAAGKVPPAPAKAEAPKLPPPPAPEKKAEAPAKQTSALERGLRTWTDRTGQHRVVARLVSVLDGKVVRLQRIDGAYVRVALEQLSGGDRQYVGSVQGSLAAR